MSTGSEILSILYIYVFLITVSVFQRLPGQPPLKPHPHRFPPAVMGPNATVDFPENYELYEDANEDDVDIGEGREGN